MPHARRPPSDARLIEASRHDRRPFGELVDRHHRAIHRYLHRRVGADLADDLAAETFARAFQSRHRYVASRDSALPWLYGIATNLVAGHRRAEERALATLGVDEAVQFDADRVADRLDAQRRSSELAAALLALPRAQRDAVCLQALGDLSLDEVAVALDTSVDAVKALLRRGRARARDGLTTTREGTADA